MAFSSNNKTMNWVCLHLLLLLIFSANAVHCGTLVKTLPGFDGELPFSLYTGYTTVNGSEMFYYFIESEGDPKIDPLVLWYSGGPGCSAFNGLIYENGPLDFNLTDYEGGIPKTYYYPYSWTRTSSMLFVDAPVGTGFSYATDASEYATSDTKTAAQVYQFLRTWLDEHPQYSKLQLFVGADSYAGVSGTIVVKHIIDGNDAGVLPRLNLKGYLLGCPRTDATINENSKYIYAHRMGLISDELYNSALESCNASFYGVTTDQAECYEDLQLMARQVKDINKNNILEPKCTWASPIPDEEPARRSMQENLYPEDYLRSPLKNPEFCHTFSYSLSYVWANSDGVRAALNIRNGTVFDWKRCNKSLDYTYDVPSVLEYHQNLSTKGLQVLIFNGDHDLIIPNTGTEAWIKELGLTIVNDWRPWLVDGQIAGYTIKYSENGYRLIYATLKGAGHSPQEYKRREAYNMFDRFIHYYPI
ncbi:PREDICTED: serine carboxypeptidase-like 17 [Fragaria vesca subsp. vesca]|uniref:serine carboxypeptidase-like 17 n=1 Tax=Fragaria vesca subsp. vesca TaxID=101020 RepID=UPI0002C2E983|nr:PREDICTED: serine carboxypeptidase-like 17 [Fragaria vesca subsp. vesca]